jgi:hypothetical protein
MITQRILTAGDSLEAIAWQAYADHSHWRELADLNDLDIFEALPVGQAINVPSLDEVKALAVKAIASQVQRLTGALSNAAAAQLDLSGLKQPAAAGEFNLIGWSL